jgi:hypothetical protein
MQQNEQDVTKQGKETKNLTSSRPITPAPMTISFFGTADKDSAPVDDTMVFSSICKRHTKSKPEVEIKLCL